MAAAKGIDLSSLYGRGAESEGNLGKAFRWLTRNRMGMHFPGTPIGWYQNHQVNALDVIEERAKERGTSSVVRCKSGVVQGLGSDGKWQDLISASDVYRRADRRSRGEEKRPEPALPPGTERGRI